MAQDQKKACSKGWGIVFIDESGFMLQPVVRRSWAPKGKTPIHYSWDRHDRLSTIAAITLAPFRRRLGIYFQVHNHNISFKEVMAFLFAVRRHLRRKFILVMDRYSAHRKAVRLLQQAGADWLEVEWLPPYAPELNPVEMLWNHTKYGELANFIPEDVDELFQAINASIKDTRKDGHLVRSFFRYAGLEL